MDTIKAGDHMAANARQAIDTALAGAKAQVVGGAPASAPAPPSASPAPPAPIRGAR